MNKKKTAQFERVLKDARRRLLEDIGDCYDETLRTSGEESADSLSGYFFHPAEAGTNNYEQDRVALLITNKSEMLSEIDAALARVKEGVFGVCEACGCEIPITRLEAIPYCRVCIKCKSKFESGKQL